MTFAEIGLGFVVGTLATWLSLVLVRIVGVVAIPNSRSSHVEAVSTSGGIGFVLAVLAFVALHLEEPVAPLVLVGGGLLAISGLVDDLRELSAPLRFLVQVGVVGVTVWLLRPEELVVGQLTLSGYWLGLVLGLAGVWLINLYNFMDGIDGLAASQMLVFGVGAALLSSGGGFALDLALWASAVVTGFLLFNWAPAKIFMGDVGSGFLGYLVWLLAVALAIADLVPFVASMVLLTVFWFDASYTLGVRVVTGQAFTSAHRSHLYQCMARRLGHGRTVTVFIAFAVGWLYPLAYAATAFPGLWLAWLVSACVPVAAACGYLGAGRAEPANLIRN